MPTYSYACKACDHSFDIRQSFTDDALTTCPNCGEPALRKVLHPVGIAFKGSGFYRNDSKASSGSSVKKESNGASAPSESASGATSGSTSGSTEGSSTPAASSDSKSSSSVAAAPSTSS